MLLGIEFFLFEFAHEWSLGRVQIININYYQISFPAKNRRMGDIYALPAIGLQRVYAIYKLLRCMYPSRHAKLSIDVSASVAIQILENKRDLQIDLSTNLNAQTA
jgi:hypothetical protein